jgi:hypothetical protein
MQEYRIKAGSKSRNSLRMYDQFFKVQVSKLSAIFLQACPETFLVPLMKKTFVVVSFITCLHSHFLALVQEVAIMKTAGVKNFKYILKIPGILFQV